jgi:hypothetical protein
MVMARVASKDGLGTISSPGMEPCTSSSVAPHRRCQRRQSGAVANSGSPLSASRMAGPILRLGMMASFDFVAGDATAAGLDQ